MCIIVGKMSLDDWDRLTWSLGWTGDRVPSGCPSSLFARLAITSLAFMLVCVPDPVCHTGSGKCASNLPSQTSRAACSIGAARLTSISERPWDVGGGVSRDDAATVQATVAVSSVSANLPEIVHAMLQPLYARFSLFALEIDMIRTQLGKMRWTRY